MSLKNSPPQLCFAGPLIGRNPGCVTTQGQILADLFRAAGYPVIEVSSHPNRYLRWLDIVTTLVRERAKIDLLIQELYGGPSFVVEDSATWVGQRCGQRIVLVTHGGSLPRYIGQFPRWARRIFQRAHCIVTPSRFIAEAIEDFGFETRVIPNTIDLAAYPYRQRQQLQPRLFWMRSFHEIWNPLMAVRVLARLRQAVPEATLVMAGQDKGLEGAARELAAQLGLNGAVRFAGFLDHQAKITEGAAADIYLNTNRVDNMPVAVLEACALGLPVVTTNVGGIPYLLKDGETGLLVPNEDEEQMVQAILTLLNDPALAARLSANGRQLAERSAWEQVRQQWEALFAEVLQAPASVRAVAGVTQQRSIG